MKKTTFVVRVQLKNETTDNYVRLKNILLDKGFTKQITADTGETFTLPRGNYIANATNTISEVLDIVLSAARTVDIKPMVLVSEIKDGGNRWAGLPRP